MSLCFLHGKAKSRPYLPNTQVVEKEIVEVIKPHPSITIKKTKTQANSITKRT